MRSVLHMLVLALVVAAAAACGGGSATTTRTVVTQAPAAQTIPAAPTPATGAAPWPPPPDPLVRAAAAGLVPEVRESLQYHVHSHLDVFVNGQPVQVPSGIGINITDPGVQHAPDPAGGNDYGGISGCATPCISPLHTHDFSGWLHTESSTPTPNRLGQFFTEWGVKLDASCVGGYCTPVAHIAVYVDGKPFTGDPAGIQLTDQKEIAVVIGTPPTGVPASPPSTPA
jgi:hypothetical protein